MKARGACRAGSANVSGNVGFFVWTLFTPSLHVRGARLLQANGLAFSRGKKERGNLGKCRAWQVILSPFFPLCGRDESGRITLRKTGGFGSDVFRGLARQTVNRLLV